MCIRDSVDIARVVTDKKYALEKHLTVKVLNAVENSTSDKLYLLQYIKHELNGDNLTTLGQFRSVITDGKKILSFAPPKSIAFDTFKSYCEYGNASILEFCEGTMINLFYNSVRGDWELATRGNIGARCKFYQHVDKTFRTMFLEAMIRVNLKFQELDTAKSYSFVLQHRDNRIVVPFTTKTLVLTNIYSFDGFVVHQEEASYVESEAARLKCCYPRSFNDISNTTHINYDAIVDHFNTMRVEYEIVGAMFIDPRTGLRTKLRNPTYEYVRRLKGNSPKRQFQYYNLRKLGKVREYLHYYPEDKSIFADFRRNLHAWTNSLLANYNDCYIKKLAPLKDFPYAFRPHMFQLHQMYLNILRPTNSYVSHKVVIDYVNNLESPRLMFAINYNNNKNEIQCQSKDIDEMLKHVQ